MALIESGTKLFYSNILEQCSSKKHFYYNLLFNLKLLFFLSLFVFFVLFTMRQSKLNFTKKKENVDDKKRYIMTKLAEYNQIEAANKSLSEKYYDPNQYKPSENNDILM